MSDLFAVLPTFDVKPYSHLLHSLEKNNVTVAQLITLDLPEIVRRCPLPTVDVRRLVQDIVQALQQDVLQGVRKKRKVVLSATQDLGDGETRPKEVQSIVAEQEKQNISTLDTRLDRALNGGLRVGHVTEIVGESAVGKTQFVLGLLLSVQLPAPRGLGKDAIYVCTEGFLNTKRLNQIVLHQAEYEGLEREDRPSLDRVHTATVTDLEAQEHVVRHQLPIAIQRYNIGLVVLDSVAANFRAEHETRTPAQLADRALDLTKLGSVLRDLAIEHHVAVVVTNQVSDRFDDSKLLSRVSFSASASSPGMPQSSLPPAMTERRQEVQSLDHQQRFFTGWGNGPDRTMYEQLKTPALGLAWANQISARIVLKMENVGYAAIGGKPREDRKKHRTFEVVFAAWAAPTSPPIRYEIAMQGIVSLSSPEEHMPASAGMSDEHADLLDEALWDTDENEEFP